jgi:hypothetical protein
MKQKPTLTLAALALIGTAHAQTISPAYLATKGPNGLVDAYIGAFSTVKTVAPVKGSTLDKWAGDWSLKFDGFAGTGLEYKLNIASVDARANWAVTPRFSGFIGIQQSGNVNAFSLSQLNLKAASLEVGVTWSVG